MNEPPALPSERTLRQVERFLDAAELAMASFDWAAVRDNAQAVLRLDPGNSDAQAMGRLGDHPHIVTVFDIGDEQGQPYIVSQYMAGGPLQTLIDQAEDHRLPLETALQIADQICQALGHAHTNGVIHRDLKPGNVWLTGVPSPPPSPIAMGEELFSQRSAVAG